MARGNIRRTTENANRDRYYPSTRTVLLVRFDDGSTDKYNDDEIRNERNPDPDLPSRRREPIQKQPRQLETGPKVFSRRDFRAALDSARVNIADAVAKTPRPDGLSRIIDVQPIKSTRRVNTYRKADELDLTLSWKSVPFDARIVRAILAFHYEGTTSPDGFSTGERELAPDNPNPTGFIVPATGDNLRWVGTIDEISDAHGDGGDIVTMKGRDLTSLLLDTEIAPGLETRMAPGTTIQEVIKNLLATDDVFELIRGPFLRTENPLPQLDAARYTRLAVVPKERHRENSAGGRPFVIRHPPKAGGKTSYWDVISELCLAHCLRPSIEKDQLVLLEPRILYSRVPEITTQPGIPSFPKPGGHRQAIGETRTTRRMVYGKNIQMLRFHRKLGRIKSPTIEVIGYNPDAERSDERRVIVRYPPTTRTNTTDAAGKKPKENFHTVQIQGVVDKTQLRDIAKQVYEGMGRQEMGIAIQTADLASFSDNPRFDPNLDPDLLDLRAGDPIEILVIPTDRETGKLFSLAELNTFISKRDKVTSGTSAVRENAVQFLVEQGWDRDDANQLVKILASANLPNEFRVISASFSFDADSGFDIQIDARNYVKVRADPEDVSQTRTTVGGG